MAFSSDKPLQSNQLPISLELTEDPNKFYQQLELLIKRINNVVNTKLGGLLQPLESASYRQLFTPSDPQSFRPGYIICIQTGALPNTGTISVAHGITLGTAFRGIKIEGAATDPGNEIIPLPFSSPVLAENIKVTVDGTNINITTGSDRTNFTDSYVFIEFVKY